MVKGISKQVIVVQSPDVKLFEQAIFILKEDAVRDGITHEDLMKEAKQLLNRRDQAVDKFRPVFSILAGAAMMGIVWVVTLLF